MEKAALKEHRRHSTADKPFSYYISNIPEYFPNAPMHWHKEFELNVILEGEGDFVTGDIHFTAYKGDIVLTPPDMLHAVYQHIKKGRVTLGGGYHIFRRGQKLAVIAMLGGNVSFYTVRS